MPHEVTNDVTALWNELKLAYDKAVQRFPDRAHEIDGVFLVVDNLRSCIIQIDGIANKQTSHGPLSVDLIDELHSILWGNIEAFDSISQHSKALFTWRDDPVSWRGKPISNILEAIRNEALEYSWVIQNCSQHKTLAPSDSLRDLYPDPWFDVAGVQGVAQKIGQRIAMAGKPVEDETLVSADQLGAFAIVGGKVIRNALREAGCKPLIESKGKGNPHQWRYCDALQALRTVKSGKLRSFNWPDSASELTTKKDSSKIPAKK